MNSSYCVVISNVRENSHLLVCSGTPTLTLKEASASLSGLFNAVPAPSKATGHNKGTNNISNGVDNSNSHSGSTANNNSSSFAAALRNLAKNANANSKVIKSNNLNNNKNIAVDESVKARSSALSTSTPKQLSGAIDVRKVNGAHTDLASSLCSL